MQNIENSISLRRPLFFVPPDPEGLRGPMVIPAHTLLSKVQGGPTMQIKFLRQKKFYLLNSKKYFDGAVLHYVQGRRGPPED